MVRAPLPENRVIAAWSQVPDGNMSERFGDPTDVIANRTKFLAALSLTLDDCVRLAVTQGTADRIREVGRDLAGRGMTGGEPPFYCDAFITSEPGLALWLLIADCLPIMFYDPKNSRIALAHCGFASTDLALAAKVAERLHDLGSNPADLQVVIRAASYRFQNDQLHKSKRLGPEWEPYLKDLGDDHTGIDLFGYNAAQLTGAGVPQTNIKASPADVATDPQYYSHVRTWRTGASEGRFAAVIALK
jgi:copper oxidase (laccase) domain-containing protein